MRIRRTVERAWRSDTSQRTAGDRRTLPLANEETSYVVAELPRPDAGRCPQRSTIRLQRWKTRTRDHRMPFSSYTGVTDAFNWVTTPIGPIVHLNLRRVSVSRRRGNRGATASKS